MAYQATLQKKTFHFKDLKTLLARASPDRSADHLAGIAAGSELERVAAQQALADVPLKAFLNEDFVPYEKDEVTRLIIDTHDKIAFKPISHLTVGEFREWLLNYSTDEAALAEVKNGVTPEMAAAVSKLMRIQDLVTVARKCRVITRFRSTIGLEGHFSTRLQPNHPTDDAKGIFASIMDGLLLGSGDAVIGINPATDNPANVMNLLKMVDDIRSQFQIPTQSCILSHITTMLQCIDEGVPVDLVFQSIAGTEKANTSFGVTLSLLDQANLAARSLKRGIVGQQVMYFETGQGAALSANAHHGMDAQTAETRAYAVARRFDPFLVNSVVGFIGPEYLYNGKQIIRAGLEDHFCAKLMGLPMGCDVCYTNHADANQDDMDVLLTLLAAAGCSYVMGLPGADDIMLSYQSTSFHDALYVRKILGLRPAPEFEEWLVKMGLWNSKKLEICTIKGLNARVTNMLLGNLSDVRDHL
ncbi:MAG: ethanolamine ammonia-lyase subunit EutB [Parachlamydiaceae bacterium]